jgi:hypothetical protein
MVASLFILGFVAWLVEISPITNATFKSFIVYALIVVGAIILIFFILAAVAAKGHVALY